MGVPTHADDLTWGARSGRCSVRERSANGSSLGLIGMEERMALAGGSFELRSSPGQGTVLLATFPLAAAGKERAVG